MNILLLIRSLEPGGAERQLVALANGLAKRGHGVTVAVFYGGGALERDLDNGPNGPELVDLKKRGRWDLPGFLLRLARLVRRRKPDATYTFLGTANLLGVLVRPLARTGARIWGVRASDMDLSRYSRLHRLHFWLERRLSRLATAIVYNSEAGRAYCQSVGFPTAKGLVIENGIDTGRFKPDPKARQRVRAEWEVGPDEPLVGLVARLDPMKDHPTFLRAASQALKQRPGLRLVCVGSGPEPHAREMRALAYQLGLADRLLWTGSRQDMPGVYNALDLCCLSSAFGEGFPNVLGEAQACGTPCVATEVGDSARVVGSTGRVVPPGDPEAMAMAMLELLDARDHNPDLRQQTRQGLGDYGLERMVERTEALLDRLAARPAP